MCYIEKRRRRAGVFGSAEAGAPRRAARGDWLFENCNANRVGAIPGGIACDRRFQETDNRMESLILAQDERWRRA